MIDRLYEAQALAAKYKAERDQARQEAKGLREELEAVHKRLMPEGMEWPRYEDGEPVRIGDEVVDEAEEFVYRVSEIAFSDGYGTCLRYEDQRDGNSYNFIDGLEPGERVKRPEPKAIDAYGVEIRIGDALYYTATGCKVTVRDINSDRTIELEGHENRGWRADLFTHRAPVLAADGKPLREGETVWLNEMGLKSKLVDRGEPLKVVAFDKKGNVGVLDRDDIVLGETSPWWFSPSCLTHERPDSWERLEEDARKGSCDYFGCDADGCDGCPAYSWNTARGGNGCGNAKMHDLVRRAKKLAGVSE